VSTQECGGVIDNDTMSLKRPLDVYEAIRKRIDDLRLAHRPAALAKRRLKSWTMPANSLS